MRYLIIAALAAISAPALAEPADDVSDQRLRADVEALVGFGTRHTPRAVFA